MNVVETLWKRFAGNVSPFLRRMRAARAVLRPIGRPRVVASVAGGLALVVIVGLLLDAATIAWATTLPDGVRRFFKWATRFGKSDWLLIPSGVVVIAVAAGDWRRVSRRVAAAWWEIGVFAAVLFVVVAATGLTTDLIKPIVGRFRPDYVADGVFAFAPFTLGGYAYYSFPSGHATTMGAIAVLAAFVPSVVTIPILIGAAVVAVSRVMIGVHFPSDVVGGALIGGGLCYVILRGMAAGGVGFAVRASGAVVRRLGILRLMLRRKSGLRALASGLLQAWRGPAS